MREKLKKYVSVSFLIGFSAFVLYLLFFSNLPSIISVMGKTSITVYSLAFLCVLFGVVFDALTWHQILGKLSVKTTFRRVFTLSWVGIFVDAIVPSGWSGDVFKAFLLSKDNGVDGSKTAASIVVKKVLELLMTLAALFFGLAFLVLNYSLDNETVIVIGIMMGLISLPLVLILYLSVSAKTSQVVFRLMRRLSTLIRGKNSATPEFENKLKKSIGEFHDGIMMLKTNPKKMFQPMIFQVVSWMFGILALFLIFASIGYIISPDKIIITNSITANIQTQGFALAGFLPIISSLLYRMLGTASLVSVTSSLLASFPTFWFKVIISFAVFQSIVFDRTIPFLKPKPESMNTQRKGLLDFTKKPKAI
jgi:uncharacterized protein (TIRG00374 family)